MSKIELADFISKEEEISTGYDGYAVDIVYETIRDEHDMRVIKREIKPFFDGISFYSDKDDDLVLTHTNMSKLVNAVIKMEEEMAVLRSEIKILKSTIEIQEEKIEIQKEILELQKEKNFSWKN